MGSTFSGETKLSKQLSVSLMGVTVPAFGALVLLALLSVSQLSDTARDSSREALAEAAQDHLHNSALEAAETISTSLRQYERGLDLVGYALSDAMGFSTSSPNYPLTSTTYYTYQTVPETTSDDPRYTEYAINPSTSSLTWVNYNSGTGAYDGFDLYLSQHVDVFMQGLYEGYESIQSVQICFTEDSKPLRILPGRRETLGNTYDCSTDYAIALAVSESNDAVYSEPYLDQWGGTADPQWLIAVSKAVKDASSAVQAVVTIELRLAVVLANVVDTTFVDSGFMQLICTDSDLSDCPEGTVVGSKVWDYDTATATELVWDQSASQISQSTWDNALVAPEDELLEFQSDGYDWFLSAHEIAPGDEGVFEVLVIARQDEVFAPMETMDDEISDASAALTTNVFLVIGVLALLLPAMGSLTVHLIVRPLAWLSDQAEKITNNATEDDLVRDVSTDEDAGGGALARLRHVMCRTEINDLVDQFKALVMDLGKQGASGGDKTAASAKETYVSRNYYKAGLTWRHELPVGATMDQGVAVGAPVEDTAEVALCSQCNGRFRVPHGAQSLECPHCQATLHLQYAAATGGSQQVLLPLAEPLQAPVAEAEVKVEPPEPVADPLPLADPLPVAEPMPE